MAEKGGRMSSRHTKANRNISTKNKAFDPKKYDMVVCPSCNSLGYVQGVKSQPCPKCGGFGYITKDQAEQGLKR
jgi:DnaJ-class molecular chaperone